MAGYIMIGKKVVKSWTFSKVMCWVIMCLHLRMAHFVEILNLYMVVSFTHDQLYYEKKDLIFIEDITCYVRHSVLTSKDGMF